MKNFFYLLLITLTLYSCGGEKKEVSDIATSDNSKFKSDSIKLDSIHRAKFESNFSKIVAEIESKKNGIEEMIKDLKSRKLNPDEIKALKEKYQLTQTKFNIYLTAFQNLILFDLRETKTSFPYLQSKLDEALKAERKLNGEQNKIVMQRDGKAAILVISRSRDPIKPIIDILIGFYVELRNEEKEKYNKQLEGVKFQDWDSIN
jgi:DNA-binding transcriptional regulator YiaG